ncbi:MAG: hypothetical protein KIS78_33490 [Labilithrix sp.]|nr:hypothetical protein [Labilithrix sp.]MCW5837357.1 hypothetical protein [Labilithrix sp.]
MSRISLRAVLVAGLGGLAVLAASCSLDLDESRIDGANDGGLVGDDGGANDGGANDGGGDAGAPVGPDASACTSDDACKTTHGCLEGKCDLTRKSCVYDVCRPAACSAAVCDQAKRTCGAAAPFKYKASQFTVGAQISCGKCAAAVHPWLFVVTGTGVVAFNVSNPSNASPPQAPIVGLGFIPSALVQSGSRVWMLGGASGPGPSRIQLAYVDAPADPFATKITAHTVLASYNRPAEGTWLFPRGGDSALLVSQAAQFPSAVLEAPLGEPASISATPMLPPQNFGPSATSGERLLLSAVNGAGNQTASFAFIDDAGSANPTTGPAVNVPDTGGGFSVHRTFAQSADGAVFWATGVHQQIVANVFVTRAARGYFLVPGAAGAIDVDDGVDLEVYNGEAVGANAAIFGGNQASAAMLDAKTAMIALQARENDQQTAVQFVRRDPLAIVQEGDGPRRQLLPIPIGTVVASAASNGVGYLVANDQGGQTPSATVYAFDPGCGL